MLNAEKNEKIFRISRKVHVELHTEPIKVKVGTSETCNEYLKDLLE